MEKVFNKKRFLLQQAVKCLVLAIVVSPWLVACSDDDPVVEPTPSVPDTPAPKDPVLDIAVGDTLFMSEKSDTKTQYIHCDTTFTVSFDSNDWIKDITPGPLAHDVYYRFSVDENMGDAVRSAKMTVNSANGLTKSFVICQDCPTRVVSQEFFYANDFLGEENKVVLHLNRAVKSLTGSVISTWLYFDKPQITLHDDHRSLTISGISGIGANHTFALGFGTINQLKQSINYEVWGCDYHWKIEGLMAAQCLPAAYPDRHYVATTWPDRLYCQNPKTGEQLFATDLSYTPLAMSYCPVNDKLYITGKDQYVHIIDAATGQEWKSVKLDLTYPYSKPNQIVMSDEGWGVIVGNDERDKYMIDANRDDQIYQIDGFTDWSDYMAINLTKGPDGKVWFHDSWRQMYRIESAEGPIAHPMQIDSKFNRPDIYYMGGNWVGIRWKRGEQKLFVSCAPGSQTIIDFSNGTYPYYSMIESRLGVAFEFDLTHTIGDDIIWWAREERDSSGEGFDFLILKNETLLFWNYRMAAPIHNFDMLHDNRTMLASFFRDTENVSYTHFMIYDVESFYTRVNLTEKNAM